MVDSKLVGQIVAEINKIPLIDTHEHTARIDDPAVHKASLFDVIRGTYIVEDFLATGMPHDDWKKAGQDPGRGWAILKDRISVLRNTAYYRALVCALRALYDPSIEEINERNWRPLSERITAAYQRPDWYKHVFRDRCHVEVALWDKVDGAPEWPTIDRDLFIPVWRLDPFLFSYRAQARALIAAKYGVGIVTFSDCRDSMEVVLDSAVANGVAAVKSNVAYQRSLSFKRSSADQAARVFATPENDVSPADARLFEDYVMQLIVEGAALRGLPVKFHTGMLSGPGYLAESSPMMLASLIKRNPKTQFVLLHGGYPFTSEAGILAKSLDNVYLDANWLPLISPTAMRRALHDWLDSVPINRIMIWGGVSYRVEGTYASLILVKQAVSEVLVEKIQMGHLSESKVPDILRDIFRNNPARLYRTDALRNWRPGAIINPAPTTA
jgi:hypothetical protein